MKKKMEGSPMTSRQREDMAMLKATKDEAVRMLFACVKIIHQLDADLTALGKGRDLSKVPGFEGWDFLKYADYMVSRMTAK